MIAKARREEEEEEISARCGVTAGGREFVTLIFLRVAAAAIEVGSERREGLNRESKASSIRAAALRCQRRDEPSLSLTHLTSLTARSRMDGI